MADYLQVDDQTLDQLVDGELSSQQRHEVLSALEQSDGGWRRCALAFLESQAWGKEFKQLAHEQRQPRVKPKRIINTSSASTARWLALAASLLVTFVLGWQAQRQWMMQAVGVQELSTQIANTTDIPVDRSTDVASLAPEEEKVAIAEFEPSDDVLTVWVQDRQGQRRAVGIPLVEARALDPRFDAQLDTQFGPAISDPIRRRIEAQGYQVNSRRRYAPLWMENGRPLVLPVEDTQIVPVSQTVY